MRPDACRTSIDQDACLTLETLRRIRGLPRDHFHVPLCVLLEGPLDVAALGAAIRTILGRHTPLATYYPDVERPEASLQHAVVDRCRRRDGWQVPLFTPRAFESALDLTVEPPDDAIADLLAGSRVGLAHESFAQPFAFDAGPLVRVRLFRGTPTRHILIVVFHHLVCDGWSLRLFIDELRAWYGAFTGGAPPVPALSGSYADYAIAQRARMATAESRAKLAAWQSQYASACEDGLTLDDLPGLRGNPENDRDATAHIDWLRCSDELSHSIAALCRQERVTPYAIWLAALCATCHLLSGKRHVWVWSAFANRTPRDRELIGWFSQGRLLRLDCLSRTTFGEAVQRCSGVVARTMADQYLPAGAIQHRFLRQAAASVHGPEALHLTLEILDDRYCRAIDAGGGVSLTPIRTVYNRATTANMVRLQVLMTEPVSLYGFSSGPRLTHAAVPAFLRAIVDVLADGISAPRQPLAALPISQHLERFPAQPSTASLSQTAQS